MSEPKPEILPPRSVDLIALAAKVDELAHQHQSATLGQAALCLAAADVWREECVRLEHDRDHLLALNAELQAACSMALIDLVTITALTGSQDTGNPTIAALRAAKAKAERGIMSDINGFKIVHPDAVTLNGLVFRHDLPVVDKCVVILPEGRAAMSEGNRPYVYPSVAEAMADIPNMGGSEP